MISTGFTPYERIRALALGLAVLAFSLVGLTACGGGSAGGEAPETVVAELPTDSTPPPTNLPDDPPGSPPPDDPPDDPPPVDPPDDPPADDPPVDAPPGDPHDTPPPIEPPIPPEELPTRVDSPAVYAIAVDTRDGTRYAVNGDTGELLTMNPGDLDPHAIGLVGVQGIRGLAFDPVDGVLLAAAKRSEEPTELLRIDPQNPPAILIGPIAGHEGVESLAWHAHDEGALYGIDIATGQLLRIDKTSGAPTVVGALSGGFDDIAGLASDAAENVLYGIGRDTGDIVEINPSTGAARHMTVLVEGPMDALAFDPLERRFISSSVPEARLFELDPKGERYQLDAVKGLAHDTAADVLYGLHAEQALLLRIDRSSGWKQSLSYLALRALEGLAWDPADGVLYAVSSALGELFRVTQEGEAEPVGRVTDAAGTASWARLAGLTFVDDALVAVDGDTGSVLRIDKTNAQAILLGTIAGHGAVESLAFDEAARRLHAFANETDAHLVLDFDAALAVTVQSHGLYDAIGGLAWLPADTTLLGTDLVEGALVDVYAPPPESLTHSEMAALALRFDSNALLAFDLETVSVVDISVTENSSTTLMAQPTLLIEAMAYDPETGIVYAANAAGGDLWTIDTDGLTARVGAADAFGANVIRAMAYDDVRNVLWAVDAATQRIVSIDTGNGEVHPGPRPEPLPFATVEAMAWDPDTDMLVGVDRETRVLFEIELASWTVRPLVEIDLAAVRGLVVVPGDEELLVIDTDLDQVIRLDRYTGVTREPIPFPSSTRGVGTAPLVQMLWPRGNVRVAGCKTFAVEVSVEYMGDAELVFRRGEKEVSRQPFEPGKVLTIAPLPEALLDALRPGETITWGVDFEYDEDLTVEFEVVACPEVDRAVAELASREALKIRSERIQRVRKARLLARHGLFSESLEILFQTAAKPKGDIVFAWALLTALRGLDETPERTNELLEIGMHSGRAPTKAQEDAKEGPAEK